VALPAVRSDSRPSGTTALALTLSLVFASSSLAQQCLHGDGETPERRYLALADLAWAARGLPPGIRLQPGQDVVAGWRLTLDVTARGHWFAIEDTTDPCGFAFVSNEAGVILRAEALR
jgi:hypothetical protein